MGRRRTRFRESKSTREQLLMRLQEDASWALNAGRSAQSTAAQAYEAAQEAEAGATKAHEEGDEAKAAKLRARAAKHRAAAAKAYAGCLGYQCFEEVLKRAEAADLPVYRLIEHRVHEEKKLVLDEDELCMLGTVVNQRLTARTSGAIRRRIRLKEESPYK